MTVDDDIPDGPPEAPASVALRGKTALGALALAAALCGAAYLITSLLPDSDTSTGNGGGLAPVVSVEPITSLPSPAASVVEPVMGSAPPRSASTVAPSPTFSPAFTAAPSGVAVAGGISAQGGPAAAADAVSTRTEKIAGGTLRISSGRLDLTGEGDQALAADDGFPVGDARCTQQLYLRPAGPTGRRVPSMMVCWRTSATRSVVTVGTGTPSAADGAAAIASEWAQLN
ncbi:hypothetical protein ACWKSP_34300 [Micromonosporaceae bacterium Da 78-11]